MNKKVLLFSRDPGGANVVAPLIKPLLARSYNVFLYGKDFALAKYRQEGLDAFDIAQKLPIINKASIAQFLKRISPDIVITGTSADDDTEKLMWKSCAEFSIPTIAIVDQWCNYGLRFSAYGVGNVKEYEHDRKHPYLPSLITAIDDFAMSEMIAEGLPADRLVVCGQPYFEKIISARNDLLEVDAFNQTHSLEQDEFVVVFASEPITTTYKNGAIGYLGYTECTILEALADTLENIVSATGLPVRLIVRPHPKEDGESLGAVLKNRHHLRWSVERNASPWVLMTRANLVVGMSSMFLLEAVVMGRPVKSIQIGLCREDPFVLSRRGIVQSILTKGELVDSLQGAIVDRKLEVPELRIITNPVERVVLEMEKLIWRI